MTAYYNEFDPYAADWLRNLIKRGLIADGEVDSRDIRAVDAADVRGFTQCHFFAGIGVWSYALRLAGWPDERAVWTGSCPCQPFSAAGRRAGTADERHLWPAWFALIEQCRPAHVFGEQVASPAGLAWLDVVHADLEGQGYAVGAADLCAASVGAPHIRQRLWFVGHANFGGSRRIARTIPRAQKEVGRSVRRHADCAELAGEAGVVADDDRNGCRGQSTARLHGRREGTGGEEQAPRGADGPQRHDADGCGAAGRMGDDGGAGLQGREQLAARDDDGHGPQAHGSTAEPSRSFWSDCDWLPCRDGKWRPVEPGTFPLAHGAPARVGRLRAYGNAIVAPVAQEFISAYLDVETMK